MPIPCSVFWESAATAHCTENHTLGFKWIALWIKTTIKFPLSVCYWHTVRAASWLLELPTGTKKVFWIELNWIYLQFFLKNTFIDVSTQWTDYLKMSRREKVNTITDVSSDDALSINCPLCSSLVQLLLIRMICASEIVIIIQRAEVWHLARHDSECTNVCDSIPPGFQRCFFYACWNPKGCICRVFRNYKRVWFCETLFWYNFWKYNEETKL